MNISQKIITYNKCDKVNDGKMENTWRFIVEFWNQNKKQLHRMIITNQTKPYLIEESIVVYFPLTLMPISIFTNPIEMFYVLKSFGLNQVLVLIEKYVDIQILVAMFLSCQFFFSSFFFFIRKILLIRWFVL